MTRARDTAGIIGSNTLTIDGSSNIGIGNTLPNSKLDISGSVSASTVSATTATFTGNVSIGGTLTYEDVTNIDSLGIVTARTGIRVLAGGINAVGVVTATTFSGSGANLTSVPYSVLTGISTSIVGDTNPRLGTNLDINGKYITGTGGVSITGIVTASAFIDDGTNLLTEINTKATTGKAIAMAMIFG